MAGGPYSGVKALVVDDSPSLRSHLVNQLSSLGMTTFEAENGLDGLKKLQDHAVGMILTDLEMPEMNGFEFCEEVRKQRAFAKVPIVVVSTFADSHFLTRALRIGADDFLAKPCELIRLQRVLARVTSSLLDEV